MAATPVQVRVWVEEPFTNYVSSYDTVRVWAGFADPVSKQSVTPDAVVWEYLSPTSLDTAVAVVPVNDSTGLYHYDLALRGVNGKWINRVQAQSSGQPLGAAQLVLYAYPDTA